MKIIKILPLVFLLVTVFLSCSENEYYYEAEDELYFVSLTSKDDSLYFGQSTLVTAEVAGKNISYKWSVNGGQISGEGYQVIFTANCACKNNEVFCTASNSKTSITRSVIIARY